MINKHKKKKKKKNFASHRKINKELNALIRKKFSFKPFRNYKFLMIKIKRVSLAWQKEEKTEKAEKAEKNYPPAPSDLDE